MGKEGRANNLFNKIIAENLPNLQKDIDTRLMGPLIDMVRNDFHCQTVKSSSKTEWTKMANN
jgi:hypothetical protein